MIEILIALSGGLCIGAAALAVGFGYRADIYKSLGHTEDAWKYFKIMWLCLCYIFLWFASAIVIPIISCFL